MVYRRVNVLSIGGGGEWRQNEFPIHANMSESVDIVYLCAVGRHPPNLEGRRTGSAACDDRTRSVGKVHFRGRLDYESRTQ